MFRTAELGRKVDKEDYHTQEPLLRSELLEIQQRLRSEAEFPVIVVFAGVDGAGKSETTNLLNAWMDPRWLATRAYGPPSDEMLERPEFWRYWRDLPPKGQIGLFLSCWYSRPVLDRVYDRISNSELEEALDRIVKFERALAEDGALIIKFWMHLGRDAQKRRLKALEKDPRTRWRVSTSDWDHWKMYDDFVAAAERVIMRTSTGRARWHIVEGEDRRYRGLTVGTTVQNAILKHFDEYAAIRSALDELHAKRDEVVPGDHQPGSGTVVTLPRTTVLDSLDMSKALDKPTYSEALEKYQGKLNQRMREAKDLGISAVLVFEGWDAAGKGGAIRRLVASLDAKDFQVIAIAAPTDEERAQHYLWRFWRHLARAGRVTVFDRSWYGRVLVERVEGFTVEPLWRRAYLEINDFEDQLVQHGIVLCKFWMHITKDEQLARFREREKVEYKRWKLTDEDWRNREKWEAYESSVNDMIERTSTLQAPWTLVEANDKRYARIKVLKTVARALKAGIERQTHTTETKKRSKRGGDKPSAQVAKSV